MQHSLEEAMIFLMFVLWKIRTNEKLWGFFWCPQFFSQREPETTFGFQLGSC